jgi:glycosyltransferase involved in cell wall biosynthesis
MPAYNEEPRIAKVIRSLPKRLKIGEREFTVAVVVVDDCSKDATVAEIRKTDATLLRHVMNSGAGAATRTGLRYAYEFGGKDLEFVITIDADGQHATSDVEKMIAYALESGADMIVGNRLHSGNKKDMPLARTIGNRGLSLISRVLFGITTEDTQSGLRLFKATALPIVTEYTIDRYGFCTEMLWLAFRSKLNVREVPITVSYSADTLAKGQSAWGVLQLLKDLLIIRMSS